jgi:hypothetical protein
MALEPPTWSNKGMTIDEALVKIRETHLASMGDHGVPVKSRYLDSSRVTRQVLEEDMTAASSLITCGKFTAMS